MTSNSALAHFDFFAISIIIVTSNNHLFLFSSETWDAALSSLSLPVLRAVMIFASFSDSFKYFHTADVFAALVRASIWSRHVIVRYNLFGLFAYYFFCYFRPNYFGCRTFGAPVKASYNYYFKNTKQKKHLVHL